MLKPELGKVAVGDRLLVVARRQAHRDEDPIEAEVTKVARVWIDLVEVGTDSYPRTWRMRLDTQNDGAETGYPTRFFTREQWETELRAKDAEVYLRKVRACPDPGSVWFNEPDRLIALANFVRQYDGLDPL